MGGGFWGVWSLQEALEDLQADQRGMGLGVWLGPRPPKGLWRTTGGQEWDGRGVTGGSGASRRPWRTYRRTRVRLDWAFGGARVL